MGVSQNSGRVAHSFRLGAILGSMFLSHGHMHEFQMSKTKYKWQGSEVGNGPTADGLANLRGQASQSRAFWTARTQQVIQMIKQLCNT